MITLVFVATHLEVHPSPKTTFILECDSVTFERGSYRKNDCRALEVRDDDILLPSVFYDFHHNSEETVDVLNVTVSVGGEYKHITISNGVVFSMNSEGATVNKQYASQTYTPSGKLPKMNYPETV